MRSSLSSSAMLARSLFFLLLFGFETSDAKVTSLDWETCNKTTVCVHFKDCGKTSDGLVFGAPIDTSCGQGMIIEQRSPTEWHFPLRMTGVDEKLDISFSLMPNVLTLAVFAEKRDPYTMSGFGKFKGDPLREKNELYLYAKWYTDENSDTSGTDLLRSNDELLVRLGNKDIFKIATKDIFEAIRDMRKPCPALIPRPCTDLRQFMTCQELSRGEISIAQHGDLPLKCSNPDLILMYQSNGVWSEVKALSCQNEQWMTDTNLPIPSTTQVVCGARNCSSCVPPADKNIRVVHTQSPNCSTLSSTLKGCPDGFRTEKGPTYEVTCAWNSEAMRSEWKAANGERVERITCEGRDGSDNGTAAGSSMGALGYSLIGASSFLLLLAAAVIAFLIYKKRRTVKQEASKPVKFEEHSETHAINVPSSLIKSSEKDAK